MSLFTINTVELLQEKWCCMNYLFLTLTFQMAKEHCMNFLEGLSNKQRGENQNWTTQYGWHTQWKKTSLAWRCDTNGTPAHTRQALHWEVPGFKRGPGRPRTNWRSTVNKYLLRMGITWEEAEVAAQNRSVWPNASSWMWVESRSRSRTLCY